LAATGQKKYQEGFSPLPEGFKIIKFNHLPALQGAISEKTVAVILELIQGEGGINVADKDFVLALRKLCDDKGILLVIDEVQTGIGRTGRMFCWQHYGIIPDIITLAKALGGGLPVGAMVVKKEIADTLKPGMHASTFGGGPVVASAALAVLKAIEKERLLQKATSSGEYLFSRLNLLKKKYPLIKEVRGLGLMAGMELALPGKAVVESCIKKGLLINCTHDKVLRLMPALNVTEREISRAAGILDSVFSEITRAVFGGKGPAGILQP
jgi:acetylornithine/N-succinyldiaminopimelate aminotransferase